MAHLELKSIGKSFRNNQVLKDLSLAVETGEILVIFGPSGTGKTVLLRLIAGVEQPSDGSLAIDGFDMSGIPPERRNIGMAFQNFALFPHLSAYENIASPLRARGERQAAIDDRVHGVARLLKIDHVLSHAPRELSNGQKQRTALARALAASPKLLLLDDPLRNVDAKLRFEMRLELPRLLRTAGSTVLYVTQDYKEAMALGDRIAVLENGSFVQVGTPEDLVGSPADGYVANFVRDIPRSHVLTLRWIMRPPAEGEALEGPKLDVRTTVRNAVPVIAANERPVCVVEDDRVVGVVDRVTCLQAIAGEGG
jgi:multiple sugar transport system ATP-binding protein